MHILFKKLDERAKLPTRSRTSDAGLDLYAIEDQWLWGVEFGTGTKPVWVRTGLAMELLDIPGLSLFGKIHDRSSMAGRGITVAGGVIDVEYRGEILVCLLNHGKPYRILEGDKIAQLIIHVHIPAEPLEVTDLSDTSRGINGFGSTGR